MTIGGVQLLYQLNRANGHIDSDQLVVHALKPKANLPLAGLPDLGYVSPLASMGYPTLEASAEATVGLQNPDAILGALRTGRLTTIVYVEKQLNASTTDNCSSTPSWALTNIVTGHPRGKTPTSSRSVSPRRRTASILPISAPRAACRTRRATPSTASAGSAAAA